MADVVRPSSFLLTGEFTTVKAENFDINGLETNVQSQVDALGELLVAEGVLSESGAKPPTPLIYAA